MRGRDAETGDYFSPSRSHQRRQALDVLALAGRLAELSDSQLARLPIPEDLLPHIEQTRRISAHVARKRQTAFLAKQMRREDDAVLDAIRDALDASGEASRAETANLHKVERWREQLLEEGNDALTRLLDEFPDADGQRLRQLVRNTHDERKRGKPPHAFRELFRELRRILAEAPAGDAPRDPAEHGEDD
ncbi:MAG: ribosome biogenesis factor YjgA [Pseudoxanthomonas suwonensis]|nr:ribosome biogenesis factor YjgA [Pseudoxanthomonas suwonensis]